MLTVKRRIGKLVCLLKRRLAKDLNIQTVRKAGLNYITYIVSPAKPIISNHRIDNLRVHQRAIARDPHNYIRITAISLVVAGAVGNLYDRVRWSRGVVDFIGPIDLGFWDFPIFNVADISISCGAILLAISFWMEEQQERKAAAAGAEAPESEGAEGAEA